MVILKYFWKIFYFSLLRFDVGMNSYLIGQYVFVDLEWGYFCLVLLVTDSFINVYVYSSPLCFFPTISSDLLWVYSRGGWSFPGCTALGTTIGFWETLYKPCVGILCCFWWDCFGKFGCKVPKWHSNSRGDVLVFSPIWFSHNTIWGSIFIMFWIWFSAWSILLVTIWVVTIAAFSILFLTFASLQPF